MSKPKLLIDTVRIELKDENDIIKECADYVYQRLVNNNIIDKDKHIVSNNGTRMIHIKDFIHDTIKHKLFPGCSHEKCIYKLIDEIDSITGEKSSEIIKNLMTQNTSK